MCKFKEKSIEDKFFFSKIWLGGHRPTVGTQISKCVTVGR